MAAAEARMLVSCMVPHVKLISRKVRGGDVLLNGGA